jgi:hypothetical protein
VIGMHDFTTLHLFNAAPEREAEIQSFIDGAMPRIRALRGFRAANLYRCTPEQLQVEARQPWRYVVVYEQTIDSPQIDLPALAPILADMRESGLVAEDQAERIFSYRMYHPWKLSGNYTSGPFTHLMFLLANIVPGHEEEYHHWYDTVHSVEVSESPGFVGMRRGRLSETQVPPVEFCPGSELILGGVQTDDLEASLKEFYDRAVGQSPSGVAWGDRSSAASIARTVHINERLAGWGAESVTA